MGGMWAFSPRRLSMVMNAPMTSMSVAEKRGTIAAQLFDFADSGMRSLSLEAAAASAVITRARPRLKESTMAMPQPRREAPPSDRVARSTASAPWQGIMPPDTPSQNSSF